MSRPPPGLLGSPLPALVPAAGPDEARAIAAAGALPLLLPRDAADLPSACALDATGAADAALAPFRRLRQPPLLVLGPAEQGPAGFPMLIRRVTQAAAAWDAATDALLIDAGQEERTLQTLADIRHGHPHLPLIAAVAGPDAVRAALACGAAAILMPFSHLSTSALPRGRADVARSRGGRAAALRLNLRRRKQGGRPEKSDLTET